jgi:L-methionine (R)-S-oxide reductase
MELQKKEGRYNRLFMQLSDLLRKSPNLNSRMSTINAVLHHKMDYYFWTGFYLLDKGDLTVGPYQGPVACQLLEKNKGVCWAAVNQKETIVVADVHKFPGHIACDSRSNSEIAIPVINSDDVIIGVLDVDSRDYNSFDEIDKVWLEKIVQSLIHGK